MSNITPRDPSLALTRVPLVPDDVLKRHNAYCAIDTRFRAAARLLQALWLARNGIASVVSESNRANSDVPPGTFASILSSDAARAGLNFIDPAIHLFVREQLLMREEGAAYDETRLFANALSSMPLSFNMFAPMALDLDLATAVFRKLLPFVGSVDLITFEHSPGRREDRFLADGSAWDLAVHVTSTTGEPGIVFVEVKYSEDMTGPAARLRERYDDVSRSSGLFINPDSPALRTEALEQLWREHMLAQLVVDQQITRRAVFMAVGPKLNRRVQAAFRLYANELIEDNSLSANRVPFVAITLESIIDAIAKAGAVDLARALWTRYCDFAEVYRIAMQNIIATASEPPKRSRPTIPTNRGPVVTQSRRSTNPTRKPASMASSKRAASTALDVSR